MHDIVIDEIAHPPSNPSECIFARTTETISADLTTQITPCQFGGTPGLFPMRMHRIHGSRRGRPLQGSRPADCRTSLHGIRSRRSRMEKADASCGSSCHTSGSVQHPQLITEQFAFQVKSRSSITPCPIHRGLIAMSGAAAISQRQTPPSSRQPNSAPALRRTACRPLR